MTTQLATGRASAIDDRLSIARALLGGAVGTFLMTAMMFLVAPVMLGRPMDVPGMLGNMLGGSWAVGLMAHLMNGIVVFPLAYVFIASRILPGAASVKGALWGAALWVVAQAMVMPLAGAGFFSAAAGGAKAAMLSLVAHLVYGASFGALAGNPSGR